MAAGDVRIVAAGTTSHDGLSPTLAMNELIAGKVANGHPVVPLGFGEASVPVPPWLAQRLAQAAPCASYGPVAGIGPLRGSVAWYFFRRDLPTVPEQIVVGPGSKALLYATLHAVGGPVVVPSPSWVTYAAQGALLNRDVAVVPTLPGQGGVPDPQHLECAFQMLALRGSGKQVTVLLTMPDNPTGTVADDETVRQVCDIAARHDAVIVADEIYRDLMHDPDRPFVSAATHAPERTVITTGLSKNMSLGGWRLGVARFPSSDLGARLQGRVLHVASEVWSSPSTPVQDAATWVYDEPDDVVAHVRRSATLHGRVANAVKDVMCSAGAHVPDVHGGFYLYPNFDEYRDLLHARWGVRTSSDLSHLLLRRFGLATLPAESFHDVDSLSLRMATSMLYGRGDLQRQRTFDSDSPADVPWVADALQRIATGVNAVLT